MANTSYSAIHCEKLDADMTIFEKIAYKMCLDFQFLISSDLVSF